ncbi:hypothetical protein JXA47_05800 [Candidatus Sumerlaeota bacterium]|nr:hypothetical protein [Candidatus Sumerlaeota bacterium]
MIPRRLLTGLALLLIPVAAMAQLPTVLVPGPDGSLTQVPPLTEPELEVVLASISAHLERGDLPTVPPDARLLIRPIDFDTGTLHFGALDMTQGREAGATPRFNPQAEGIEVTFGAPLTGQLLMMAFNPDPANPAHAGLEECGWLFAVSGTAPPDPAVVAEVEEGSRAEVAMRSTENDTVANEVRTVRSNMRSLATAIEAYRIDWNAYPPAADAGSPRSFNWEDPLMAQRSGFNGAVLTTPVAYITMLPPDPFAISGKGTCAYATFEHTDPWFGVFGMWALLSPGPDGDWDIDLADPTQAGSLQQLLYDPAANGSVSSGDLIRSQMRPE